MKQYNYGTTGATFSEIDYGKRMHGNHSINVVYSDGKTFIHSQGWVDSHEEAEQLIRDRAAKFGVTLVGFERVA